MSPRLRKLIGLFGILAFLLLYMGGVCAGPRPLAVHLLRTGRRLLGRADPSTDLLDEPRAIGLFGIAATMIARL